MGFITDITFRIIQLTRDCFDIECHCDPRDPGSVFSKNVDTHKPNEKRLAIGSAGYATNGLGIGAHKGLATRKVLRSYEPASCQV
jgi:hypothetical protein